MLIFIGSFLICESSKVKKAQVEQGWAFGWNPKALND